MVWLGFLSFLAKNSWRGAQSCDHIVILSKGCIRGKGCGRSWNREQLKEQLCPVSEPRVWGVRWKNGGVWTDYRGPKCCTTSRTGLRGKKKEKSRVLPLEQGVQHL